MDAEYDRSVVGTVTDPTGSVVVNATVTLTNNATDDKRMTMVGETGDYQFLAGLLVVVTLSLGLTVSKLWLIGTGFVGVGLIFAGVSDICMMASLLGRLPWNRSRQTCV